MRIADQKPEHIFHLFVSLRSEHIHLVRRTMTKVAAESVVFWRFSVFLFAAAENAILAARLCSVRRPNLDRQTFRSRKAEDQAESADERQG